jgi:hypothetical protein
MISAAVAQHIALLQDQLVATGRNTQCLSICVLLLHVVGGDPLCTDAPAQSGRLR